MVLVQLNTASQASPSPPDVDDPPSLVSLYLKNLMFPYAMP